MLRDVHTDMSGPWGRVQLETGYQPTSPLADQFSYLYQSRAVSPELVGVSPFVLSLQGVTSVLIHSRNRLKNNRLETADIDVVLESR